MGAQLFAGYWWKHPAETLVLAAIRNFKFPISNPFGTGGATRWLAPPARPRPGHSDVEPNLAFYGRWSLAHH
jgi:hypothetical protein